jgi:metal-responsive CopG/Arc/MetJ family transcriptional regulator
MKIKTSITLSQQVLHLIDKHSRDFKSRSEFMEQAARSLLANLARSEAERRDLEIINRSADRLNAEAEDVLSYQVPL